MPNPNALLANAMAAHQAGRLDEAADGYRRVLKRRPDDPDALHFFGMLQFNRGNAAKGIESIQRSLAVDSKNPHAWNNLGNIFVMQGRAAEAKQAYLRVIGLAPNMAETWLNLAICARDAGEFEDAERHFRTCLQLQPGFLRAYELLGMLQYRLGQFEQAAHTYRQWTKRDPDNPIARHMAAATSGIDVPARADDSYVAKLFDRFAADFDQNLQKLGYRAPELVGSALLARRAANLERIDILDAGCGTGLCGPMLRPLARTLVGVDLSGKMIDLARERGYDALHVGELVAFMQQHPGQFDVIVSADTLVYFGALEEACQAAHAALRNGGLLIFTVEALTDNMSSTSSDPYRLQVHGRYTHREDYVRRTLADAGLQILDLHGEVLRMERMQEVNGWLVVAQKGSC